MQVLHIICITHFLVLELLVLAYCDLLIILSSYYDLFPSMEHIHFSFLESFRVDILYALGEVAQANFKLTQM
jgi:hypothetical protein